MSSGKGLSDFPDLEAKLHKPTKQSAFEKQRAEADAKRKREAAETAAVFEDFVKSFDDDEREHNSGTRAFLPPRSHFGSSGQPPVPGASRRHFGTSSLKSGPGSLGPSPASFGKKRSFQDFSKNSNEKAPLGTHDAGVASSIAKAFEGSDDDESADVLERAEEKAIARPTLRLSHLPPATSLAMIKGLMPDNLAVEQVKILPPSALGTHEKKYVTAIVTLSKETPAVSIDSAVSALQNRYLGYGHYLSLHRHLSSAVTSSSVLPSVAQSSSSHPFGAKPVEQGSHTNKPASQAIPPREFAPPSSYAQLQSSTPRTNLLHVPVQPPSDIKTIQLVSKVVEGVLEHGPEFEALLMSRQEVQRDEKWAWIWDARSQGGIWYRWRLWAIVTGSHATLEKGKYVPVFDGSYAWKSPDKRLTFEFITDLAEFVSDSDYDSSDEEEMEDGNPENPGHVTTNAFLNPLEKANLTHLLARLPTTLSKVRKGDISRLTAFALSHASHGSDEVVNLVISNIEQPLSMTFANPRRRHEGRVGQQINGTDDTSTTDIPDSSGAALVGLYVISDILSSSSTSGVRHAWRFRQLFETMLRDRKIFEHLGMMAERLGWGRLRAEKWKRSVTLVLNLWEGWCVFPTDTQEHFVSTFENPPSTKVEEVVEELQQVKGRWKAVKLTAITADDDVTRPSRPLSPNTIGVTSSTRVGTLESQVEKDTTNLIDLEDLEGEAITDDDADEPMEGATPETKPNITQMAVGGGKAQPSSGPTEDPSERVKNRKRMRAADLFADSDEADSI